MNILTAAKLAKETGLYIQCVTQEATGIKLKPTAALNKYHVYHNGELINESYEPASYELQQAWNVVG